MPRTARASAADYCYHVLNRGNGGAEVFHKPADYPAFLEMIAAAQVRLPMRVLGYCLMPNHFHLVLRPFDDGDLSRFMQWLLTTHVRRYRREYGSSGHVWQGRFKAFPCQNGEHLETVLRYVERNPLRARVVRRAEKWPYSSLHAATKAAVKQVSGQVALDSGTVKHDAAWVGRVNAVMSPVELADLRRCVTRNAPYGSPSWTAKTARALGLESSLRARGRPKKTSPKVKR